MPLLMCPNCQSGMKTIDREGVQLDMCPQCHGVWLDRGELQKLIDNVDDAPATQSVPQVDDDRMRGERAHDARYAQQRHHDDDRDDDYRGDKYRGDYDRHYDKYGHGKYRKKSKMERIFDIFD